MNEVIIFCKNFVDFKQIWQDLLVAGYNLLHLYYTNDPYMLSNSLVPFSASIHSTNHKCRTFVNSSFLVFLLLWHQILESFLLKLGENPHSWRLQRLWYYRSKILLLESWCCSGGSQKDVLGCGRCRCWWKRLELFQGWATYALSSRGAGSHARPSLTTLARVLGCAWRSARLWWIKGAELLEIWGWDLFLPTFSGNG